MRRTMICQVFARFMITYRFVLIYILPLTFTRVRNNATLPLFLDSVSSIEQFVSRAGTNSNSVFPKPVVAL